MKEHEGQRGIGFAIAGSGSSLAASASLQVFPSLSTRFQHLANSLRPTLLRLRLRLGEFDSERLESPVRDPPGAEDARPVLSGWSVEARGGWNLSVWAIRQLG